MNVKIAICDDETQTAQYIKRLVIDWAEKNNINAHINIFDGAESFKDAWDKDKGIDILLLDIQMGGQNGMELARELRSSGSRLVIVFITAFTDYVHEGYDVSAFHYLLKPLKEDKFFETLDKAYKGISETNRFLMVNSGSRDYRIPFDDIIYIEAFRNIVVIAGTVGQYEVKRNISAIEKELDNTFFRCQRSYIVMLKHIKYISRTDVLLDNGKLISLSRNIYKDLYKAFINCFKGERERK